MTREQAINVKWGADIHYTGRHACTRTVGPRGGVTERITHCRPSGKCQTWKTRPEDFRLPVKHGLYESSAIERHNAAYFHLAEDCPLLHEEKRMMESVAQAMRESGLLD